MNNTIETLTPMQQTKNHFDTFAKLLGSNFKQTNLNKSSPKSYTDHFCGEKTEYINKGVKSDFIRTFKLNQDEHIYSLGFSFSFNENLSNPSISFSCTDSYKNIKRFSKTIVVNDINELKNKMNQVNSTLKELSNSLDCEKLNLIQLEFLGFNFLKEPIKKHSTRKTNRNKTKI